jgi:hypothetical protein
MMLRIALFLIGTSLAFGQASENTKTAKIIEIFRLTKTDQMQKQMLNQMVEMNAAIDPKMRATSQKTMDLIGQKMSWDAMKADYIKLYDDTYTEDEISGILMFYQSAPGQAFINKTPVLMSNMMAMVQKRMTELKPEMDRLIRESAGK